jgi:hypothetical protein
MLVKKNIARRVVRMLNLQQMQSSAILILGENWPKEAYV